MISEPMTMATDYALAAANSCFGWRLARSASRARRCWAAGFLALAVCALVGGSFHGLRAAAGPGVLATLWQITELSAGVASLFLLAGVAYAATEPAPRRWIMVFAAGKFLAFAALAVATDRYLLVVADTGITMLVALVLALLRLRTGEAFARWLVAGIGVSGIAAGVQASGLAPHPHFNHNDLYHVIQLLAMYLLYRAGMLMNGRRTSLPAPAMPLEAGS
jgi:hypothetical protein